jgi:LAO/AO transport system kinase
LDILSDLKKGRRKAIAKAISIIENDKSESQKLIKKIFKDCGNSIVIGITGPAGAGKSSLINKTVLELKKLGVNPAVLAIDPTSHLTGGAILGDRVRMIESTDSGTYIRSIASRGATGAIAHSIRNSIRVLEYAGFDPIIIESVGAGQTEIEISNISDITSVIFNPHTGDSIQTIKAGLTEIGDIYIVNKADLDGALQLFDAVRDYIGSASSGKIIVFKTSTKTNEGISKFARKLKELMKEKRKTKKEKEGQRLESELKDIILNNVKEKIDFMSDNKTYTKYLKLVRSKKLNPVDAAEKILQLVIK